MVSHITIMKGTKNTVEVLILVVMDNGLVPLEDYPVVDDCDIINDNLIDIDDCDDINIKLIEELWT